MLRTILSFSLLLFCAACCSCAEASEVDPIVGAAHFDPAAAAEGDWVVTRESGETSALTPDDVRDAFAEQGYDVDVLESLDSVDPDQKPKCKLTVNGEEVEFVAGAMACFQGTTKSFPTVHYCIDGNWVDTYVECVPVGGQ